MSAEIIANESRAHEPAPAITVNTFNPEGDTNSALLVIPPKALDNFSSARLVQPLAEKFKVHVVAGFLPSVTEVEEYSENLAKTLENSKIKRLTVFGYGAGGNIAQALAIRQPKLVRRVVLLDSSTRLAPTLSTRIIDSIEAYLPLGLPLRPLSKEFDSRPLLHRIHCPTLVLLSSLASPFLEQQGTLLAERIPNASHFKLKESITGPEGGFSAELVQLTAEFLQVPVKRPQKSLDT